MVPGPRQLQYLVRQFGGAIAFYTVIPFPPGWPLEFRAIARWAPLIGILLGGLLGLLDAGLTELRMPGFCRSALIVTVWVGITGGLHLDGAMDTADGLSVQDPSRRLTVMADSHTGAFGAMAAGLILLLKTAALSDLGTHRPWAFMAAAGWGRWGQLVAIAAYPYLKPFGKGAFHKAAIHSWDLLPGTLLLMGLGWAWGGLGLVPWQWAVGSGVAGSAIAGGLGWWLWRQLGGHTGDTYGAIVEWTEALLLCSLVSLQYW